MVRCVTSVRYNSRMTERKASDDPWEAVTWEGARKQLLKSSLSATPAQRLAWLEEVLEIAHRAGALGTKPAKRRS